jgi:hypothetical protein
MVPVEDNPVDAILDATGASFSNGSAAEAEVTAPIGRASCAALEPPGMGFFSTLLTPLVILWPHHIFVPDVVVSGYVWFQ